MLKSHQQIWKMFWGNLNTPESYPTDWYSALTNQSAHWAWAAAAVCAICAAYVLYFQEMPPRWELWLIVVFSYSFIIEYLRQGWRKHDSFNDTYFIALGAGGPLISLYEVRIHPQVDLGLTYNGWGFAAWAIVVVISFAAHVIPRIIRKIKEDENKQ